MTKCSLCSCTDMPLSKYRGMLSQFMDEDYQFVSNPNWAVDLCDLCARKLGLLPKEVTDKIKEVDKWVRDKRKPTGLLEDK